MKKLAALIFAVLMMTGCMDLFGPTTGTFPPGTVQMAPLDSYPIWWHEVEACSGITSDFSGVYFWKVEGALDFRLPGDTNDIVMGYFVVPMNIVLAGEVIEWKDIVQHEMLHALLYAQFKTKYYAVKGDQNRAHPDEYFKKRCPFVAQNSRRSARGLLLPQ